MKNLKRVILTLMVLFSLYVCGNNLILNAYAQESETVPDENYFIVTDYGAKGDGIVDDGENIQNAIDACNEAGGGTVYFPQGTYCVSKTVFFYSNQNLLFEDGAVMKRIPNEEKVQDTCGVYLCNWFDTADTNSETSATACRNVTIIGGTFDGSGSIPDENPVAVAMINTCHAENVTISNCRFINNYNAHCIEINSSDFVTIENCEFSEYIGTSSNVEYNEMIQIDKSINSSLGSFLDGNSYRIIRGYNSETYIDYDSPDCRECSNISIKNCKFISNQYCSAIGNHHQSSYTTFSNAIYIFNNVFSGGTSKRGYIVFDCHTSEIEIYENQFYGGECGVTANADDAYCYVYNNEFYDCKTVAKGDVTAYDNYIEGGSAENSDSGMFGVFDAIIEFLDMLIYLLDMILGF